MELNIIHSILFIILLVIIYYYKKRIEHFDDSDIVKFTLSDSDQTRFFNYSNNIFSYGTEPIIFTTTQKDVSNGVIPLIIDNKYIQFKQSTNRKTRTTQFIMEPLNSSYTPVIYNIIQKQIKLGSGYLTTNNYKDLFESVMYVNTVQMNII